jgi:hypothetical protein
LYYKKQTFDRLVEKEIKEKKKIKIGKWALTTNLAAAQFEHKFRSLTTTRETSDRTHRVTP